MVGRRRSRSTLDDEQYEVDASYDFGALAVHTVSRRFTTTELGDNYC